MNDKQLSERLLKVAYYVPKGAKLADIGSDHAYLPTFLAHRDPTFSAIAGEVNQGPFDSAKEQVMHSNLTKQIEVRKGDGLQVIEIEDQVTVITIAGMGGALIQSILENGKEKLETVETLILQPNIGAVFIRKWLSANGWKLTHESILEEDEKIYEILVASRGDEHGLYAEDVEKKWMLGPYLMKEKSAAFQKKWKQELQHWKSIVQSIEKAGHDSKNKERIHELKNKITLVEECL
ncbi:tRNA (adenine(22)-N(1))-methyltransferase [Alkalihalobacillus trypoxylicola]|uniref:SAM-dependent methyltransferase n=1 Tax=Alkalihalobacillus trypoxylicola TaxID=519424 RepID=A0A162E8Q1_9BACI|nr:tRNA (adenine(22)-N(1))-methyltransferase TrmK [Alkalihalobacillus trypoxylicola]KYG32051.1 SAM-dependent methyltransferase [Alkalihalobacillus trypoxylicola]